MMSAETLQAVFAKATAAYDCGDRAIALTHLNVMLGHLPENPEILNFTATINFELGHPKEAIALLRRAVTAQPEFTNAWGNLGRLAQAAGDDEDAVEAYERVCRLAPDTSSAHFNLGHCLQRLGRYEDAINAYRRGLGLTPDFADGWAAFARALLWLGQWEEALAATAQALSRFPGHTGSLALRSVALAETGRLDEWAEIMDLERLIGSFRPSIPNGFNRILVDYCTSHPSLVYQPSDNTTEMGSQTGNLALEAEPGPIHQLIAMIEAMVADYRTQHPLIVGHPFLGQRPDAWRFDVWGTVLGRHGHQRTHIHRDGWLSGVYYAQLPKDLNATPESRDGWIEFGRPHVYPQASAPVTERLFRPEEGTMFLFPSYCYHRTLPFGSKAPRISIAFDLLPTS